MPAGRPTKYKEDYMEHNSMLYVKCLAVVQGCATSDQLMTARKYVINAYQGLDSFEREEIVKTVYLKNMDIFKDG